MSRYHYRCFDCRKEYEAGFIESGFHYLCPSCGASERNQPLRGVLTIAYDYAGLQKSLQRERFLANPAGKFWLYPELWPLQRGAQSIFEGITDSLLERLSLSAAGVVEYQYGGKTILIQDESRNPTLSFKDRASILTVLKAMQLGIGEICAASTGNAGSSLAGICARAGVAAHLFVPARIPEAKRIQIQAFGAKLYLTEGSYDDAFDLCIDVVKRKGWFSRNTAHNPLTIEGKKWGAYDLFLNTRGKLPDSILVPVGDGVIIAGMYKGLQELQQLGWIDHLPRLIAVQATGSDAVARYTAEGTFTFREASTIADSISAGAPRNLYMAAEAVQATGGAAITVTDDEILEAQQELAESFGLLSEPSCSAVLAGLKKLPDATTGNAPLLLLTGNGLKDVQALSRWNPAPEPRTPQGWLDVLAGTP